MKSILFSCLFLHLLGNVSLADQPSDGFVITIEIPRLKVSEYHRPYVAAWIQDENKKSVANIAVWYQMREGREGAGTKWLPDLRQWWRRSGRSLAMPVDGVSAQHGLPEHTRYPFQPMILDLRN